MGWPYDTHARLGLSLSPHRFSDWRNLFQDESIGLRIFILIMLPVFSGSSSGTRVWLFSGGAWADPGCAHLDSLHRYLWIYLLGRTEWIPTVTACQRSVLQGHSDFVLMSIVGIGCAAS
jgi:hypothetical protein